eukprot:Partr_v1_DN24551_c1_g1_i3_m19819 putative RNA polymerase II, TATA box binding protein (TBP)-associated factor
MLNKIKLKMGPGGPTIPGAPEKKKGRRGRPPSKARLMEDETTGYPREEHCILRMPPNDPLTVAFREIVRKRRDFPVDMEILWKDNRRGLFKFNGEVLFAKLVDLPCIIESQKTFDRRQFHKVADICQMIIVERIPAATPDNPDPQQAFFAKTTYSESFVENSGITPPLKHCRIRRFRKRVNKRTLESIEKEVERLLKEDQKAEKVETIFVDPTELEDRLGGDGDEDDTANLDDFDDDDDMTQTRNDSDDESSVDSELAAELEDEIARAMEEASSEEDEEEEEFDDQDGAEFEAVLEEIEEEDDEDAEMDLELRGLLDQQKTLREEMRDLETKIGEKSGQKSKAVNAIIQKRFDDIIKKLQSEQDIKRQQLADLESKIEDTRETAEEEFTSNSNKKADETAMISPIDESGAAETSTT